MEKQLQRKRTSRSKAPEKILVQVKSAKGLKNTDWTMCGKSDPYVVCSRVVSADEAPIQVFRTATINDSLAPLWHHGPERVDQDSFIELLFEVFDEDETTSEKLGECRIPHADCKEGFGEQEYSLGAGKGFITVSAFPASSDADETKAEDLHLTSIVQFAAPTFYGEQGESMTVHVMRMGFVESICSVEYFSEPSDFEGRRFEHAKGKLEFAAGERYKTFQLQLLDCADYDGLSLEVLLRLRHPENCDMGLHLRQTRVKLRDHNVFPTNKFLQPKYQRDLFRSDEWRRGKEVFFLVEFAKFCFKSSRRGSLKIMVADQIDNLIYIVRLVVMQQLVNDLGKAEIEEKIFATTDAEELEIRICVYALALLIPYSATHFLSYKRQFWGVGGALRMALKRNLLAEFCFYAESRRHYMDEYEWMSTFKYESDQLISTGYMQFFTMLALTGRICLVFAFIAGAAVRNLNETEGEGHLFVAFIPFPIMLILIVLYFMFRMHGNEKARDNVNAAEVDLDHFVGETVQHYRTIADYWNRPLVVEQATESIRRLNKLLVVQGSRAANDHAFFGWVAQIIEFSIIIAMGTLVANSRIQIGTFTACLAAIKGAASTFQSAYGTLLQMQSTFAALWRLVEYMNVPTDLKMRKKMVEEDIAEFKEKLEEVVTNRAEGKIKKDVVAADMIPLTLEDCTFSYSSPNDDKQQGDGSSADTGEALPRAAGAAIISKVNVEIMQGEMVGVMGNYSSGKSTLLQLIGGVLVPESGRRFVPPHLRVLHVKINDKLWERPLAESLFFGIMRKKGVLHASELQDVDKERGIRICEELSLDNKVMNLVNEELFTMNSSTPLGAYGSSEQKNIRKSKRKEAKQLSATSCHKLQIARALITDPEVLVIHSPVGQANPEGVGIIMSLLRRYVDERGVGYPSSSSSSRRRPRTCIISLATPVHLHSCHRILKTESGTLAELNKNQQADHSRSAFEAMGVNHTKVYETCNPDVNSPSAASSMLSDKETDLVAV
jgi:ABC-type multidrug transport system fused ATPase/permease subunit